MSSVDDNFFPRLSFVVDNHFKNPTRLCKKAGIGRQNYTNWKNEYEKEGKEPNLKLETLKPIIDVIYNETDINIGWLLTGKGERYATDQSQTVIDQVADHKKKVDQLNNSEQPSDEIAQYLLKHRKEVLDFLRSLE